MVWLSDDMLLCRVVTGICAGGWLLWTGEGGVTSTGIELGIFLGTETCFGGIADIYGDCVFVLLGELEPA